MTRLFDEVGPVVTGLYAQVALERGLEKPRGLTYAVPESLRDLRVGDRVVVPLGKGDKPVSGYVLALSERCELEPGTVEPIAAGDGRSVNLPDDLVELAQWRSRYYCCPLGVVLATMLPAAVKRGTGVVRRLYGDLHDPIAQASLPS